MKYTQHNPEEHISLQWRVAQRRESTLHAAATFTERVIENRRTFHAQASAPAAHAPMHQLVAIEQNKAEAAVLQPAVSTQPEAEVSLNEVPQTYAAPAQSVSAVPAELSFTSLHHARQDVEAAYEQEGGRDELQPTA